MPTENNTLSLPKLYLLTGDSRLFVIWAKRQHPRLVRLVVYAKTGRRRDKNLRRLVRMFAEEVYACT